MVGYRRSVPLAELSSIKRDSSSGAPPADQRAPHPVQYVVRSALLGCSHRRGGSGVRASQLEMKHKNAVTVLATLLLVVLLGASVVSRQRVEALRGPEATLEEILYVPSSKALK